METTPARRRPSLGTALGLVAILIASMGTSYAAGVTITKSSQIKNGIITSADVKNRTLRVEDLSPAAVKTLKPVAETWRVVGTAGRPDFTPGWSHQAGSYYDVAFRKDAAGRVQLRGAATFGSDTANFNSVFTLPQAYRPAVCVVHSVASFDGAGTQSQYGAVEICPDGMIAMYGDTDERFVSLDGIAFDLS